MSQLEIFTGARGSRFVCDAGFGDVVASISIAADAPISSCAREEEARPLLKQIGKMDQAWLYRCSLNCTGDCGGNCNPANPPGKSTHERRNDVAAYSWWPPGFKLPKWARGIDVERDRVAAFCGEARKRGYIVTLTYPGSPSESQHVNFRKEPKFNLWKVRPLHPGDGGPRARQVIKILAYINNPRTGKPYLGHGTKQFHGVAGNHKLSPTVTEAVKAFQHDHHQKPDGIVGIHTIHSLRAAKRRARKRRAADKKKEHKHG